MFTVPIIAEIRIDASVEGVVLALVVGVSTTGCHSVVLLGNAALWQRHPVIFKMHKISCRDVFSICADIVRISVTIVAQKKDVIATIGEERDTVSDDTGFGFVE